MFSNMATQDQAQEAACRFSFEKTKEGKRPVVVAVEKAVATEVSNTRIGRF